MIPKGRGRSVSPAFTFILDCGYVCGYAHMHAGVWGGQKRASYPLELELEVVMSSRKWLLGTKFGSSARQYILLATEPSFRTSSSPLDYQKSVFVVTSVPGVSSHPVYQALQPLKAD